MKNINEILIIVRGLIGHRVIGIGPMYYNFICNCFNLALETRKITKDEYDYGLIYFKSNEPTLTHHIEFYNHRNYVRGYKGLGAWWLAGEIEQRRLFLTKLIDAI